MDTNHPSFWQSNYEQGRLPWDLSGPTRVFRRLAESGRFPPGRMIVLGAGTGHDARLFGRHGYQVTAVDFAPGAVRAMHAQQEAAAPIVILKADLFALPPALMGLFDYILEYVCYCAIDPARRGEYGGVVNSLLRPGGILLALAFPVDERVGGPPFAVSPDEMIAQFAARGFRLLHREIPVDSIKPRRGVEELLVLQKPGGRPALKIVDI